MHTGFRILIVIVAGAICAPILLAGGWMPSRNRYNNDCRAPFPNGIFSHLFSFGAAGRAWR